MWAILKGLGLKFNVEYNLKNKKLRETRKVQSASFGILTQIIFLIFKHFNKNKLKIDIPVRSLPRSAD